MASVISVFTTKGDVYGAITAALPNETVHFVDDPETDEQFRKSEIIITDFYRLGRYVYELPNAKWIHCTSAGIEKLYPYIKPDQPPNLIFTRSSGKHYGTLMSEYVIANIINRERSFFETRENQKKIEWIRKSTSFQLRTLEDLTIGVMGLGAYGEKMARKLNLLGAKIIGYGRQSKLDVKHREYISEYYTKTNLGDFLRKCDYFVNALPSTTETEGLLNGNVLEDCKDKPTVFINVGRGSIISEICLVEALTNKWLAGAILDVQEEEPLRKESPLWTMEDVFITPHIAENIQPRHIAAHFAENLKLYKQNLPLSPVVDFRKVH